MLDFVSVVQREREKRHPGVTTGTTPTQSTSTPTSWAPFIPPNAEPAAMDIDATHIREEYLRQMHGRCWGCGSTVHTRKEGNHDCDLCVYCKKVGH